MATTPPSGGNITPQIFQPSDINGFEYEIPKDPALAQLLLQTSMRAMLAEQAGRKKDLVIVQQKTAIADGAVRESKLETTSVTDHLTGLYNRRFTEKEFEIMHRAGPVGVLMIDIDNFKNVNDTLGHPMGDKYIQHVGTTINEMLGRKTDIVGRWGGEEFLVLLPGLKDPIKLAEFADKVRDAVEKSTAPGERPLRISVGSALSLEPRERPETIIEHADTALYTSKRNGRNQVSIFDNGQMFRFDKGALLPVETAFKEPSAPEARSVTASAPTKTNG